MFTLTALICIPTWIYMITIRGVFGVGEENILLTPSLTQNLRMLLFGILVFGPVLETTIFSISIDFLNRLSGKSNKLTLGLTATASGAVHWWGAGSWIAFAPAAWGFFWFGYVFLEHRSTGFYRALSLAIALHFICNIPAAIVLVMN